jgi:hypothetical protein
MFIGFNHTKAFHHVHTLANPTKNCVLCCKKKLQVRNIKFDMEDSFKAILPLIYASKIIALNNPPSKTHLE